MSTESKECNKYLIEEVSEELSVSISTVSAAIHHYASFIARTIASGSLEGVFVPYLGKFQVKHNYQQYRAYLHSLPKPFKKVFEDTTIKAQIKNRLK